MSQLPDWHARMAEREPSEVAARMLRRMFGDPPPALDCAGLTAFQVDALARVQRIVVRRRGAILADSVGLGKTHVAVALIRATVQAGRPVFVSGPAALAVHWRRHLRSTQGWRWLSHTMLSRHGAFVTPSASSAGPRALAVVDEAHAFRNPGTHRYAALAGLCANADLLLVTATPVNNSLMDLYHLIRLFAGDGDFGDVGVPDLLSAFRLATERGDTRMLRRVVRTVMVRRTRPHIARHFRAGADLPAPMRFPERERTRLIHYDLEAQYPLLRTRLIDGIAALTFPAHGVLHHHPPVELLRLGLLKRLESSVPAFHASLERHRLVIREFTEAALRGLLFDVRSSSTRDAGGVRQLALQELTLQPWPDGLDRDELLRRAASDAARLQSIADALPDTAAGDPKLTALEALVRDELATETIIVFAEYRDTAVAVWRRLLPAGGVALIHGTDVRLGAGRSGRRAVLDRFAPLANRARPPRAHERVRILVSTDVLSEGLNLQDARVVISYDMPWNPVRLAQREGRIDRLGSPHASILPCVFVPDRGVDAMLGLMRAVRRKLRAIRAAGTGARQSVVQRKALDTMAGNDAMWLEHLRNLRRQPEAVPDLAVPVAAVTWREPGRAALCCVSGADSSWLVLYRQGQPPAIDPPEADDILSRALAHAACRDPDRAWLLSAGMAAVRVVAESSHPSRSTSRVANTAARAVHAWLAGRVGGASDADCAAADRVLAFLARPMDAATERSVALAIRRGRLHRDLQPLAGLSPHPGVSSHVRTGTGPRTGNWRRGQTGFTPVAMLELVPAAAAGPG